MAEWEVRQETDYLEFVDDAYAVPGKVTFFSPAEPEAGFYDDRKMAIEEIPALLEKLDKLGWTNELHLPPEGEKVIATDGEHIATAQNGGKYQGLEWAGWVTIDPIKGLLVGQNITHWMSVPGLPEGD